MAKQQSSAFDEILGTFTVPEDREAFTGLTERNPWLKEYGLRQSDYSRKLEENSKSLKELEEWRAWRDENWDSEASATKAQAELTRNLEKERAEKVRLEEQLAFGDLGGGAMNFSDIEGDLDKFIQARGLVTGDTLKAKEQEFRTMQGAMSHAALQVPFLNQKHYNEFGELFDPDTFLKEATDKGRYDLRDYYEKDFVVTKREDARQAKHDAELAKVKAESEAAIEKANKDAEERVARMQGMGPTGAPTDADGPQMGPFQSRYLKLADKPGDGSEAPNVELGEGGIAAFAANKFAQDKRAGR